MTNLLKHLVFDLKRLISLDAFTEKKYGIADLLLFSHFIEAGIILNVDGSFTSSYWFYGNDLNSATPAEINQLSIIINNAFSRLNSGWAIHIDCVRRQSSGYIAAHDCHFADATTFTIDHERRLQYADNGTHYENDYVITFTHLPLNPAATKASAFLLNSRSKINTNSENREEPNTANNSYSASLTLHLDNFKATLANVIAILKGKYFKLMPLNDEEMLNHLYYCINGQHVKCGSLPPDYCFNELRYLLARQDVVTGFYPLIGEQHMRVISLGERFPDHTYPNLLDELNHLGFEYRWSVRYIFLSTHDADNMLKRISNLHHQKQESLQESFKKSYGLSTGKIDRAQAFYANETEEALASLATGKLHFGKYTSVVIIFDANLEHLNAKVKLAEAAINKCRLLAKIENAHSFEAYLGSIPSMVRPNVRKHIMHCYNLADLMPATAIWSGYHRHPCRYYAANDAVLFYASTAANTPFRGCLHVNDNGHTLIIGGDGSKLINFLSAQQRRYQGAKIFIFDDNYAALPLCYALNGSHYDFSAQDAPQLQPLARLEESADFTFAVTWLSELCSLNGFTLTNQHHNIISEVLHNIRAEALPQQRTLDYFYYHLKARHAELANQFKPYTASAGNALTHKLFSGAANHLYLSDFTVFEMRHLINKGENLLIPTMRYLLHLIEGAMDGSPITISIHNGCSLLKHPIFVTILDDWLRNSIRLNVQVILGAQSLHEILTSSIRDILLQNCLTRIFSSNANALDNQSANYLSIGLNEQQIALISHAVNGREYYFTNPLGSRLLNFDFGELTHIFINPPAINQLPLLQRLKKEHAHLFAYYFIKYHKLPDQIAEFWLYHFKRLAAAFSNFNYSEDNRLATRLNTPDAADQERPL